jgi:hypothetical protein
MKQKLLLIFTLLPFIGFGQNYTSYFTGNSTNVVSSPFGGVCLMGGATEDDNAMKWFLQRANGGDILVLRTTGSNGYNSYLYSGLGVTVNSVETIVCNNALASSDPYVIQKFNKLKQFGLQGVTNGHTLAIGGIHQLTVQLIKLFIKEILLLVEQVQEWQYKASIIFLHNMAR